MPLYVDPVAKVHDRNGSVGKEEWLSFLDRIYLRWTGTFHFKPHLVFWAGCEYSEQ